MNSVPLALQEMQRWMFEALTAPESVTRAALAEHVLPGAMLDAAGCLAIYQRSYILRLRRCLVEQFPASCHALGEDLLCDFIDDYLHDCPSQSYTLYELGRRFPDWIEQNRPDHDAPEHEPWIDFMVDLASYEQQLFRLFDAPGSEGQPSPGAEAEDASLVLNPHLVLEQYRYPVAWYYHAVRAGQAPELPAQSSQHVAVVRRDYQTTTYPISALHHRFLANLQQLGRVDLALAELAGWSGRPLDAVRQSWREEVRAPWIAAGFFIAAGYVCGE